MGVFHQIRSEGGKNEVIYILLSLWCYRYGGDFHDSPQDVENCRHDYTNK